MEIVTFTPLQFGMPGGMELAVILLIAILLFGANKIPKLARSTGQAMGEFRRGREEVEQELEDLQETADPSASISDGDSGEGETSTTSSAGSSESEDAEEETEK